MKISRTAGLGKPAKMFVFSFDFVHISFTVSWFVYCMCALCVGVYVPAKRGVD